MPLLLGAVLVVLALIALVPLSIVLRYRAGTSRRRARSWIVTLNFTGLVVSVAFFLTAAAVSNVWVPDAFAYATAGLAIGGILGALGLGLTRWESAPGSLHYTPNRWLVLAITLVVAAPHRVRLLARLARVAGRTGRRVVVRRGRRRGIDRGRSRGARLLPGLLVGRKATPQTPRRDIG